MLSQASPPAPPPPLAPPADAPSTETPPAEKPQGERVDETQWGHRGYKDPKTGVWTPWTDADEPQDPSATSSGSGGPPASSSGSGGSSACYVKPAHHFTESQIISQGDAQASAARARIALRNSGVWAEVDASSTQIGTGV